MLFSAFIPEFFLITVILFQLLCNSKLIFNLKYNFPIIISEVCYQTIFILIFLFLILYNLQIEVVTSWNIQSTYGSCRLIKLLVVFFSILVSYIILPALIVQKLNFFEVFTLLLFSIFSIFLLVGSYNLVSFYLTLEMQTICFYILTAYKRRSVFSTEAGLKYFIIGSFVSGCFLLGIVLIYSYLGTVDLQDISNLLLHGLNDSRGSSIVGIGVGLITYTLLFKLACYPFHFWAPDVYEGAPLSSTIIFSILPKIGLIFFLVKWLFCVYTFIHFWNWILIWVGLSSCLIGAAMSVAQERFKRLIIYSSIAQTGFIMVALGVFTEKALIALWMFLIVYLITSILLWGHLTLFYFFKFRINSLDKNEVAAFYLTNLSGFFLKNKLWAVSLLIILFSIAGIPPLTGFLAKLVILLESVRFFSLLAVCLIIISTISVFYYIRIIKIIYFEGKTFISNENEKFQVVFLNTHLKKIYFIFVCLLSSLILIFFFPANLYLFCKCVALNIFLHGKIFFVKTLML